MASPALRWAASSAMTEGNLHKSYLLNLLNLAAAGIPVPASWLLRAGDGVDESDLPSTFGAGPVVAKSAVGAGGRRLSRLPNVAAVRSSELVSASGVVLEDLLLQEFLAAVEAAGEYALVVIAGQVSHLVHKVAAAGEFRVQLPTAAPSSSVKRGVLTPGMKTPMLLHHKHRNAR